MVPMQTYRLLTPVSREAETALAAFSPLARTLLLNRGFTDSDAANAFLSPNYDKDLHDPFLLTDMERAVSRLISAIRADEHVVIYSDYDCDGIPGGVVLHDLFKAVGFSNFENYIPHRHYEGFGFNKDAAVKLAESGAKLIITIDCGTVDHEAVAAAAERGVDVIITDHHEPSETLPSAYAILNPKRDDAYPFKGLCGAGVVYKLVQGFLARAKAEGLVTLAPGQEKWFLDMVGVATIADMVPLTGENRALAHYGLTVLRKSRRPGLQHLFKLSKTNQRYLTEDDIGFTIGPRINAASRMDTPEDAFHLLSTTDEGDAGTRAAHLEHLNNERKGVVASMSKELHKRLEGFTEIPRVIVIGNPDWKPALVGLSANSLVELYKRPAFIWGRDGNGVIKGSCRSDGETSVIMLMDAVRECFIEYGGHHASGGFSVHPEKIHVLHDALGDAHEALTRNGDAIVDEILIDADLTLDDVDDGLYRTLRTLAPYGEGNRKPVFRFLEVTPESVAPFGKTKEHTKLVFKTKRGPLEAISFFNLPEDFGVTPEVGKACTLIAHAEESFFMGRLQKRLRIIAVL